MDALGDSVRIARELREKLAKTLAHETGISAARLSRIEKGKTEATDDELTALAEALQFPRNFFIRDAVLARPDNPQYRGLARIPAPKRRRVEALGALYCMIVDAVESRAPQRARLSHDVPVLRRGDPEAQAREVRDLLDIGSGPVADVVGILEGLGVWVHVLDEGAREIDAYSFWDKRGRPHVVLNHFKADAYRSRYDASHELLHLCAHRDLPPSRDLEREANAFAAAFLVPADRWNRQSPRSSSPYDYLEHKATWRVSAAMLIRRSHTLEHITDRQYESAMVQYSMLRWRNGEPGMWNVPHERPRRLHDLLTELELRRISRRGWLERELGIPADVIESLLGVSPAA